MITPAYVGTLARYNRWQNESLYRAAATLSDTERCADRGAFFGSIHGTLNHILWGDQIWMSRFAGTPPPRVGTIKDSVALCSTWSDLVAERESFDETIVAWSEQVDEAWLDGTLTWYSGAMGRELTKPRGLLVVHMFNHQTHHRGQVHALLTSCGARPDATDIAFMDRD